MGFPAQIWAFSRYVLKTTNLQYNFNKALHPTTAHNLIPTVRCDSRFGAKRMNETKTGLCHT